MIPKSTFLALESKFGRGDRLMVYLLWSILLKVEDRLRGSVQGGLIGLVGVFCFAGDRSSVQARVLLILYDCMMFDALYRWLVGCS